MPKNFGKKIEAFAHNPGRTIKNEANRWAADVSNNQRLEEVKKLADKYKVYINNHEFDIKIPNPSDPLNINNAEKIKLSWATRDASANDKAKFDQLEYALKCVDGVKTANLNNGQNAELPSFIRQLDPIGVIIADRICKDLYNRDNGEYSNLLGFRGCYDYACNGVDVRYPTKIEYPINWYGVSTTAMFEKFETNTGLLQNSIIEHVSSPKTLENQPIASKIEQSTDLSDELNKLSIDKPKKVEEIVVAKPVVVKPFEDSSSISQKTSEDSGKVTSSLLAEKVKLNNGAEFEVKDILKCLSDKSFINMILKGVNPEVHGLLEQEIVLKLVYDVNQGRINKINAGNIISSFDNLNLSNSWLEYNDFTTEEITAEEAQLTGGVSYLE